MPTRILFVLRWEQYCNRGESSLGIHTPRRTYARRIYAAPGIPVKPSKATGRTVGAGSTTAY
jgi:hypothetical protein